MTGAHRADDGRLTADTEYAPPVLFGQLDPSIVTAWSDLLTEHGGPCRMPGCVVCDHPDGPIVVDFAAAYATGDPAPEHHPVHDFHDVPTAERTGPLPIIPAALAVPVNRIHVVLRDTLGLDWIQRSDDPALFDIDGPDANPEFERWTRGQLDRFRGPVRDVTEQYIRRLAEPTWPRLDPDRPRWFKLGRRDYPTWDPSRLANHALVILAAVWLAWGASRHIVTGWFFVAVGVLCGLEGLRLAFPAATARWARWGRLRAATAWMRVTALSRR